jgi:hypothetical protein
MDWDLVIDINRRALLRLVRALLDTVGAGETVARFLYLDARARLLKAEASARRLIAIAARGLVVAPRRKRAGPSGRIPKGSGDRVAPFALFDPRRDAGPPKDPVVPGFGPNVRGFDGSGVTPPEAVETSPDDLVSVARLQRRLAALLAALEDIPGQARRLARRQAGMERPLRPMRPGRPPGHNARGRTPLDILLADCHELALMALADVPP